MYGSGGSYRGTFRGRRKFYRKTRGPTRFIAKKALKTAAKVRSLVHPEIFYFDKTVLGQTVSSTGALTLLTDIQQGDNLNNRSGDRVWAKSINCRIIMHGNSQNASNAMRFMLLSDTQNNAAAPAVTDVLQINGDERSVISPLNAVTTPRFKILYDKTFVFSWGATSASYTVNPVQAHVMKIYKKLNLPLHFNGTTTGTQYRNPIYLLAVSDVASNDPTFSLYSRVGYLDN